MRYRHKRILLRAIAALFQETQFPAKYFNDITRVVGHSRAFFSSGKNGVARQRNSRLITTQPAVIHLTMACDAICPSRLRGMRKSSPPVTPVTVQPHGFWQLSANREVHPMMPHIDFDEKPFIAIWETTQACDLACLHCRACAQPARSSDELTTQEAKRLIDEIAEMAVPVFVLTGGDPRKRRDSLESVRHASDRKVRISLTPSATPLLTREAIVKL